MRGARAAPRRPAIRVCHHGGMPAPERQRLEQEQGLRFDDIPPERLQELKRKYRSEYGDEAFGQDWQEAWRRHNSLKAYLSSYGPAHLEEAVKAGYGPTIRADAVKKLVDSVVNFQERSQQIIEEMRKAATNNSAEIRDAVEDGKRRIAKLVADGRALPV